MKLLKRTWADVSLDALAHNYRAIRGHIPAGCKFLGVMKADAYGHGAVPMSHALVELGAGKQLWDVPLAFGESDGERRVKALLAWKPLTIPRKLLGLCAAALVMCLFLGTP